MTGTLMDYKLQVIRGNKAKDLSKVVLYKPADFSYGLFSQYRRLDPKRCADRTAMRFGQPSFSLDGPVGARVEGWLIRVLGLEEIVYLESWPWEPSFFIYTSGNEQLMAKLLIWLGDESPALHIVKGGGTYKNSRHS